MARSMGRAVLAIGVAIGLSGCGTAVNTLWLTPLEGGMSAYGGVRVDAGMVREGVAQAIGADSLDSFADGAYFTVVGVLDLPLSAVGDTLTLPVVLAAALKEAGGEGDNDSPQESTRSERLDFVAPCVADGNQGTSGHLGRVGR